MDRKMVFVAMGALLVAACPKNVPQDLATGDDGRQKGALELKLENNEARSGGIVTYPGGDRVDWKVIDLPKEQHGTLKLKLRWTPPRPGLDLSFEVYNEYGRVLASAKPNKRGRSRKTSKSVEVENAQGKVFVQIYASERGDAGKYALVADWEPAPPPDIVDWLALPVANPPVLPAVLPNPKTCTPQTYDPKEPACQDVCPIPYDAKAPGCANVCPTPVDPENAICQKTAACPTPKDRRFLSCVYPVCDRRNLDPTNPRCDGLTALRDDVNGEVTDVRATDLGTRITINLGTADGIADGWKGVLLDANGVAVRGGTFVVRQVGKNSSVIDLKLDVSKIPSKPLVRMSQE